METNQIMTPEEAEMINQFMEYEGPPPQYNVYFDDLIPVYNKLIALLPVGAAIELRNKAVLNRMRGGTGDGLYIDTMFPAVLHFIKWYNQNQK